MLISASGPAVIGHDLRLAGSPWLNRLGDLAVLVSLMLPLLPLLSLLQLTDGLLPDGHDARSQQSWEQLLRQAFTLVLLELVLVLGGVGLIQSLSLARALEHSLGRPQRAAGGSDAGAGCSAKPWPCPCSCTSAAEHFRQWTTAANWCTAIGSRCWRCWECCLASIFCD